MLYEDFKKFIRNIPIEVYFLKALLKEKGINLTYDMLFGIGCGLKPYFSEHNVDGDKEIVRQLMNKLCIDFPNWSFKDENIRYENILILLKSKCNVIAFIEHEHNVYKALLKLMDDKTLIIKRDPFQPYETIPVENLYKLIHFTKLFSDFEPYNYGSLYISDVRPLLQDQIFLKSIYQNMHSYIYNYGEEVVEKFEHKPNMKNNLYLTRLLYSKYLSKVGKKLNNEKLIEFSIKFKEISKEFILLNNDYNISKLKELTKFEKEICSQLLESIRRGK